ncbi:CoA transferase [Hydrogenophaga sp.]|uniref:CoA transferase n=1 Tax=Hydrogenophaga sp. TaxID=1904254 RepID=UPI00272695D8|nr:CoA transferase [Hydrogenophaga sp.]MDO9435381.1 CoA transferase [Hydrogenophaga sp.]
MNHDLLRGVRIIESSAFIAAPLAGLTLAQFGAEVIRVDMIGGGIDYRRLPTLGGGRSLYWTGLNKEKKSIAIDLRSPAGRELLRRLVCAPGRDGGVLLTNIGVPWLSHAELSHLRKDLISCTVEGNSDGSTAVDFTVNCASGLPMWADSGSGPQNTPFPWWDYCCAYQVAFGIAAALRKRALSGSGSELRIALSDVAFTAMSHMGILAESELLQVEREPIGNHIYGAFGHDFRTGDGGRVMVAAISIGQWNALVNCCGLQESVAELEKRTGRDLTLEAERFALREELVALCRPWFAGRTREQAESALAAAGVCWGRYQSVSELVQQDPRLRGEVYETVSTPGIGEHRTAGTAIRQAGVRRQSTQPAPWLGQHTDEVLASVLGIDAEEIGQLHRDGTVAGPEGDPFHGV